MRYPATTHGIPQATVQYSEGLFTGTSLIGELSAVPGFEAVGSVCQSVQWSITKTEGGEVPGPLTMKKTARPHVLHPV